MKIEFKSSWWWVCDYDGAPIAKFRTIRDAQNWISWQEVNKLLHAHHTVTNK